MERIKFQLVREFLLLAILSSSFLGIECHVKGRIKPYGKEYTKASLDLSDLSPGKKVIVNNCSSVLWSDENCIVGPISFTGKTILPALRQQICPQPFGKFYISCGFYAVCQNETATINKCPEISDESSGGVCPKTKSSACISTGSWDVNFIKSLVANQGNRLTQPATSGDEGESVEDSGIHPDNKNRTELRREGRKEVGKESSSSDLPPQDKDEETGKKSLAENPLVQNATNEGDSHRTEDVLRESEQTGSIGREFQEPAEVSLCGNFGNGKIIRHPKSCEHFIQCVFGVETIRRCGPGTVFNAATSVCDWRSNVPDCIGTAAGDGDPINLNDNRVRRSVVDHYNVISDSSSVVSSEVLGKQVSSGRVRRDVVSSKRKCSWGENYIQPHPTFCNKFEICSNGRIVEESCGPGSVFNGLALICDQPGNVDCLSRKVDYSTYGCTKDGPSYRSSDPESCSKFVECDRGDLHVKSCPPGTLYNAEEELCDFEYKVGCKKPISLEHDIDVNYLPPLRSPRSARGRMGLNLACDFNYIAPNPRFCNQFVECENKRLFFKSCGPGTVFNGQIGQCDWAYNTRQRDPRNCNQYLQCEGSEYRVKRCLGNTVFNAEAKKCIFTPRFPDDCHGATTTTTTTTTTSRPLPPDPESAFQDYQLEADQLPPV